MFEDSIHRLTKIRRYVQKTQLEQLEENNFLSTIADEVIYSLTLCMKDLARIDKVLEKEKENGIKI